MAKYKNVTVTGKFMWAKVFPFNREMKDRDGELIKHKWDADLVPDDEAGHYEISIILTPEEMKRLKDAGARQQPKKDPETGLPKMIEGGYQFKFTRLHCVPKYPKAGGAPKVIWRDKTSYNVEEHGLIGNLSEGSLEVSVAHLTGPKGDYTRTTLEGVIIDELVTYEKPEDKPAPEPEKPAKKPAKAKVEVEDDEIPF